MAQSETLDAVRHDHHHAPAVGEPSRLLRHGLLVARIEPRRGLVEEQERRIGQQFHSHARSFALSAGQAIDGNVGPLRQSQLADHLVDPSLALVPAHVGREAQLGRKPKRPAHRELGMEDVVLRDVADALPELIRGFIEVQAVHQYPAGLGRSEAGERLEKRRLAGSRRAQQREQSAFLQRERDIVEDLLATGQDRRGPSRLEHRCWSLLHTPDSESPSAQPPMTTVAAERTTSLLALRPSTNVPPRLPRSSTSHDCRSSLRSSA